MAGRGQAVSFNAGAVSQVSPAAWFAHFGFCSARRRADLLSHGRQPDTDVGLPIGFPLLPTDALDGRPKNCTEGVRRDAWPALQTTLTAIGGV